MFIVGIIVFLFLVRLFEHYFHYAYFKNVKIQASQK